MMNTSLLSLNSTVTQSKGNLVSDMEGSKVMLNIEHGKYYDLGAVGGDIWNMMVSPIKLEGIIENLLTNYDVDSEICKEQVLSFISQLLKENLIVVSD